MSTSTYVIVGFAILGVVLAVIGQRQARKRYEVLANELAPLGFTAKPQRGLLGARLEGDYRGRAAKVRHVKHGKNGPWTTNLTLEANVPDHVRLAVSREDFGAKIAKFFGGKDFEVGDVEFDQRFRVTAKTVDHVVALTPDLRGRLSALPLNRVDAESHACVLQLDGRLWESVTIGAAFEALTTFTERVELLT